MKSERIDSTSEKEIDYPVLMQAGTGRVILLTSPTVGVVVHEPSDSSPPIGAHSTNWSLDCLTAFNGTVKLSN